MATWCPLIPISRSSPRPNQPQVPRNLPLPYDPTPPLRPWPTAPSSVAWAPSSPFRSIYNPLSTWQLLRSFTRQLLPRPTCTGMDSHCLQNKTLQLQVPKAQVTWKPPPWLLPAFLLSLTKPCRLSHLLSENLPQGLAGTVLKCLSSLCGLNDCVPKPHRLKPRPSG